MEVKFRTLGGFEKIKPRIVVDNNDLEVYGYKDWLIPIPVGFDTHYTKRERNLLSDRETKDRKNKLVTYTGAGLIKYYCFVPDKTEGLITGIKQEEGKKFYAITWADREGLDCSFSRYTVNGNNYGWNPKINLSAGHLKLVIPNKIDFKELSSQAQTAWEMDN